MERPCHTRICGQSNEMVTILIASCFKLVTEAEFYRTCFYHILSSWCLRWFAKRFLHPDIVAEYDYIFLWDEDLGVDSFNPKLYVMLLTSFFFLIMSNNDIKNWLFGNYYVSLSNSVIWHLTWLLSEAYIEISLTPFFFWHKALSWNPLNLI